jgi:hypothetical protein
VPFLGLRKLKREKGKVNISFRKDQHRDQLQLRSGQLLQCRFFLNFSQQLFFFFFFFFFFFRLTGVIVPTIEE